jgi:outer membrane protein TolC
VEEQQQLSADRLRLAQYRFDIGAGIKPEVLQAQIDYNNSTAARINQLSLIDQRRVSLNQLMNVDRNATYKVSDSIPVQTDIALGDLLSNLALSSPDLQLARVNIEAAGLNVRLAQASRYPTVQLVSAYNFNRTSNNQVINPFSPLFNLNRGLNYWRAGKHPDPEQFYGAATDTPGRTGGKLPGPDIPQPGGFTYHKSAERIPKLYRTKRRGEHPDTSVVLARENLFIERERYRLGRTTYIELRQAEENISTIVTNLINARYNLKVSETELLRLRGELVR